MSESALRPPEPSHERVVARRTLLYAVGEGISRSAGFILLPILARSLSKEEFGAVAIAKVMASLLSIALCLGLPSSAVREHFRTDERGRRQVYGDLWLLLIFVACLAATLGLLFGKRLAALADSPIPFSPYLSMAIVAAVFNSAMVALPREYMKASGFAGRFVTINSLQTFSNVVLVAALVLGLGGGAKAAMIAHAASFFVAGLFGVWFLTRRVELGVRLQILPGALAYGLPLVPHFLSHWVLSAADRLFIARMLSLADTATYHVTYQLASLVLLLAFAGSGAQLPLIGRFRGEAAGATRLSQFNTTYVLSVSASAVVLAATGPTAIRILAGSDYSTNAVLLPTISIGFVFVALYSLPVNLITTVMGKSRIAGLLSLGAASFNLLANFVLIPKWGLAGAAIATTSSYLLLFLGFFVMARSGPAIPYETTRLGGGLAVSCLGIAAIVHFQRLQSWRFILLSTTLTLAAIAALALVRRQQYK